MSREPTIKCRIFVSRKTADKQVAKRIRKVLQKFSPNLEFFDAEDIQGGEGWRNRLRQELKRASILLLVLTKPARDDFDWPLYEAGLFDSLDEEVRRKVVCVYADPGDSSGQAQRAEMGVPSQLGDRQAIRATKESILKLLLDLFTDNEFTNTVEPLNPHLTADDLGPIAEIIANVINRDESDQVKQIEYANSYLQLLLPRGVASLQDDLEVESNATSLDQIFDAGKAPPEGKRWLWGEIAKRAARIIPEERDLAGFNRRWIQQLDTAISAMRSGDKVHQLKGRFVAADGKLYRPEIEIYRIYENGRLTVDVTFSEQVQDSWLHTARVPVALAANLALGSRVRHELIEPYLLLTRRWRNEATRRDGCRKLTEIVEQIEHDGFFIGWLTKNQLQGAFDDAESDELAELNQEYASKIRPLLEVALRDVEIDHLRQALATWEKNNLRFLHIGLHRYDQMLKQPEASELLTTGTFQISEVSA